MRVEICTPEMIQKLILDDAKVGGTVIRNGERLSAIPFTDEVKRCCFSKNTLMFSPNIPFVIDAFC